MKSPLRGTACAFALGAGLCLPGGAQGHDSYRIAEGDTLYSIALRHGVDMGVLAAANDIADPGIIAAGDSLTIPAQDAPPPSTTSDQPGGGRSAQAARAAGEGAQDPTRAVMSLPVQTQNRQLPPVTAEITTRELIAISPAGLAESLRSVISAESAETLNALGTRLRPPAELEPLGVRAALDPALLSIVLQLEPPILREHRLGLGAADSESPDAIRPNRFAAGLTGAVNVRHAPDGGDTTGNLVLNGFANIGGYGGLNADYGVIYDFSDTAPDSRLRRDRTQIFYDDRRRIARYSAGDQMPFMPRLAGRFDTLGIGVERNYEVLDPRRNIRPAGQRSFLLERPSTIEVYANGALVSRFQAEAGPIRLSDIPAVQLSNQVTIIVEDDLGRRELDSFSIGSDLTLLAGGLTEFSFNAGLLRDPFAFGQFDYSSDLGAGASFSRGLSDSVTLGGHALYSADLSNAGGTLGLAALRGVLQVETAISTAADAGEGYAVGLRYRGQPAGAENSDQLTLSLDHQSENYSEFPAQGVSSGLEWSASVDYRRDLTPLVSVFGGASRFSYRDGLSDQTSTYLGATRYFGPVSLSLSAQYSQGGLREGFGAFISLSRAFGPRGFFSASYDTVNRTGRAEYRRGRGFEIPEIDYRIGVTETDGDTRASGAVGFTNTRFTTRLDYEQSIDDTNSSVLGARVQSGIAIVDGMAAVGRDPARGFYMFRRHSSLEDARLNVRSGGLGQTRGRSDRFGPAVVPVLQPYRDEILQVFAEDLPPGYNLGDTRYNLLPGARTGHSIMIGDDNYRTVVASLIADGAALGLRYGRLSNLETGEEATFFTNRSGRAAFNALRPGRYEGRVDGWSGSFRFELAADAEPYTDLGTIDLETAP